MVWGRGLTFDARAEALAYLKAKARARAGSWSVYTPTLRGEAAEDGAPAMRRLESRRTRSNSARRESRKRGSRALRILVSLVWRLPGICLVLWIYIQQTCMPNLPSNPEEPMQTLKMMLGSFVVGACCVGNAQSAPPYRCRN